MDAHVYASRAPPLFRYSIPPRWNQIAQFIDTSMPNLTLNDRLLYSVAPISWNDELGLDVVRKFVQMYNNNLLVDFGSALQNSDCLSAMNRVEAAMARNEEPNSSPAELGVLERYHKLTVLYIWFCYRNPVMFSGFEEVSALKQRLEHALNWCLQGMSYMDDTELQLEPRKSKDNKIAFVSAWNVMKKPSVREKPHHVVVKLHS